MGLVLYGANWAVARVAVPRFTGGGMELRVALCHLIFGLITAAVYKGMTAGPSLKKVN